MQSSTCRVSGIVQGVASSSSTRFLGSWASRSSRAAGVRAYSAAVVPSKYWLRFLIACSKWRPPGVVAADWISLTTLLRIAVFWSCTSPARAACPAGALPGAAPDGLGFAAVLTGPPAVDPGAGPDAAGGKSGDGPLE